MAARTTAVVSFAIFFIFGVGCSWRGVRVMDMFEGVVERNRNIIIAAAVVVVILVIIYLYTRGHLSGII
jgi:hypothetical protein